MIEKLKVRRQEEDLLEVQSKTLSYFFYSLIANFQNFLHIFKFLANNKLEVFIIIEIWGTMIYRRKVGM